MSDPRLQIWDDELEEVGEFVEDGEVVCEMKGGWRPVDERDTRHILDWIIKTALEQGVLRRRLA